VKSWYGTCPVISLRICIEQLLGCGDDKILIG
jgi:hypothetical protein